MVVARDTTMEPISPSELGRGRMGPLGRNVGVPQQGMQLARMIGPAGQSFVRSPSGRSGCEETVRRQASVGGGGGVLCRAGP